MVQIKIINESNRQIEFAISFNQRPAVEHTFGLTIVNYIAFQFARHREGVTSLVTTGAVGAGATKRVRVEYRNPYITITSVWYGLALVHGQNEHIGSGIRITKRFRQEELGVYRSVRIQMINMIFEIVVICVVICVVIYIINWIYVSQQEKTSTSFIGAVGKLFGVVGDLFGVVGDMFRVFDEL